MMGVVFNPVTHHLVKTGLVYISTNPPDATVYVDGRQAHQKTPTILRDLTPGKHFIRIEHTGYNDWERDIPIVAKKATLLANTLLIPENWPIKPISRQSYQNIIITNDGILVGINPILKNIDIIQTPQGLTENFSEGSNYTITPLFTKDSIYKKGVLVRLYNAPKSPFILIEATIKDKNKFLWVNLKENPPLIEDISDFFPQIPSRVDWDGSDNDNIFAFYPQIIYRINIKDKAIYLQDPVKLPKRLTFQTLDTEAILINDKNDLLTHEGQWIRLYPKQAFDAPQVYDIAKAKPSTNMYFEEKSGELFFLDNGTGSLCAAQILPFHPILNIPIPDALRFKITKKESI